MEQRPRTLQGGAYATEMRWKGRKRASCNHTPLERFMALYLHPSRTVVQLKGCKLPPLKCTESRSFGIGKYLLAGSPEIAAGRSQRTRGHSAGSARKVSVQARANFSRGTTASPE